MPIQKQPVEFPLAKGRNAGANPQLVIDQNLDVVNMIHDSTGKLEKRPGFEQDTTVSLDASSEIKGMFPDGEGGVLIAVTDRNSADAAVTSTDLYRPRMIRRIGSTISAGNWRDFTSYPNFVDTNTISLGACTSSTIEDTVCAFTDELIWLKAKEGSTNITRAWNKVTKQRVVYYTATNPTFLIGIGDTVVWITFSGSNVNYNKVPDSTISLSGTTTLATDHVGATNGAIGYVYDSTNDRIILCYEDTSNDLAYIAITASTGVVEETNTVAGTLSNTAIGVMIVDAAADTYQIVYNDNSTIKKVEIIVGTSVGTPASFSVPAGTTDFVSGGRESAWSSGQHVYLGYDPSVTYRISVRPDNISTWCSFENLRVISEPFEGPSGEVYFWANFPDDNTGPMYLLLTFDSDIVTVSGVYPPIVVASLFAGFASADFGTHARQYTVGALSATTFETVLIELTDREGPQLPIIHYITMDFGVKHPPFVQQEDKLFIAGGPLKVFSGALIGAGWMNTPFITATAGSGGSMVAGDYGVAMHYTLTDSTGLIYRSRVHSKIVTVATNEKITVSDLGRGNLVPSMYLDDPSSASWGFSIKEEWFCTETDGLVYYKVGDNLTEIDVVDADITPNAVMYTTGSVLENDFPPDAALIAAYQDRMMLVPMEDRDTIWISKKREENIGLEFSAFLTMKVPGIDEITAIESMDDTFVVYGRNTIKIFNGTGPTKTGVGTFSPPRTISASIGCLDFRTLTYFQEGHLFKSEQGWYVLDRGFQLIWVGEGVADYDSTEVLFSITTERRTILIALDNGSDLAANLLEFDYQNKQWFRWTAAQPYAAMARVTSGQGSALRACSIQGSNLELYDQTTAAVDDDGTDFLMQLDTPWFKFEGSMTGPVRVQRIYLLGDYLSPHTLSIKVYYDYQETVVETRTVAITADPGEYLYFFIPKRQQCTSFRLRITEVSPDGTGNSFTLSGIKAIVGRKMKNLLSTAKIV